jgi:hypothetical protein
MTTTTTMMLRLEVEAKMLRHNAYQHMSMTTCYRWNFGISQWSVSRNL